MSESFQSEKDRASGWFRTLRDDIVATFEGLEDSHAKGPLSNAAAGRFDVSETKRTSEDGSDAGGGLMSVMRGGACSKRSGSISRRSTARWANGHKKQWPRAVYPEWQRIRVFGHQASVWLRICKTPTRQRCI